jgi:fatty-acyl-CoA synthase
MSFPVFDFLERRADLAPLSVAMEDLASGISYTYRDMHERSGCTASLLDACGVAAGDRVAVLCRNRVEFFELLFACARIGALLVPLNWRMPRAELEPLLQDCGARLVLFGMEDEAVAAGLEKPGRTLLGLDDDSAAGLSARRDALPVKPGRMTCTADEAWYLLYTSGTTGQPKAVIQTFGMALANYVNISQAMGLRASDTTLCFLPLFHSGGINLTALPALMMGARVLITPAIDPELTIRLIAAGRLDTFFGVPAVYQAISLNSAFETIDLRRVRCWACGGAPLPDELFRRFQDKGVTVLNGMGMTETGPTVFLMDAQNAARKIGSVGKPQSMSAVRLVDANGSDVAPGETGELWFSGLGVTPGYFEKVEITRQAIVEGKWLRSGDLGRQDADGYYYIVGRSKDMYISGGENVYPAEVENRLASHPDILEAAVVAMPDARWGEVGCAYVLLRPGHEFPGEAPLTDWLRGQMAAYKVPKQFIVLTEFPRTAAGKVQKHLLGKTG